MKKGDNVKATLSAIGAPVDGEGNTTFDQVGFEIPLTETGVALLEQCREALQTIAESPVFEERILKLVDESEIDAVKENWVSACIESFSKVRGEVELLNAIARAKGVVTEVKKAGPELLLGM